MRTVRCSGRRGGVSAPMHVGIHRWGYLPGRGVSAPVHTGIPPCEQNHRRLWKHNLAATTLRTVNIRFCFHFRWLRKGLEKLLEKRPLSFRPLCSILIWIDIWQVLDCPLGIGLKKGKITINGWFSFQFIMDSSGGSRIPQMGDNPWVWGKNLLFGNFFSKNWMKMKIIGPGGASMVPLQIRQWIRIHRSNSSGSSGRVRGGRETWNLCGCLRRPSFIMIYFHRARGAMAPLPSPLDRYWAIRRKCYISEMS